MLTTLVIDDNSEVIDALVKQAGQQGIELLTASTIEGGIETAGKLNIDIILLPDMISDQPSCYSIQDFQQVATGCEILIYSEQGDEEHAEYALQNGAWDYVVSPFPEEKLPEMLRRIVRFCRNKKDGVEKRERELRQQLQHYGIVGSSSAMQNCLNLVARLGQSDASVLITGETGTGKELFASAIHNISKRTARKLVVVDCAALPSTLVESILFGHVKGSFTGADKTQHGLIKQADGGSLFLDEVGEMPLEIQKKFLRVLQEMNYYQVGSSTPQRSDFRLIAATNKDLDGMVAEGTFREDLLFRLKTFQLELPALRDRKKDITELVYHFRNIYCRKNKLRKKKLTTNYLTILNRYEWPGNVRELFQAVEFSLECAKESEILDAPHLPVDIRLAVTKKSMTDKSQQDVDLAYSELPDELSLMPTMKEDRERAISEQEKRYLETLLRLSGGNIKKCCDTAGLSRSRLYDLLKKHDLSRNAPILHSE